MGGVAALAVAACGPAVAPPTKRVPLPSVAGDGPVPAFAADLDHGARLFARHCARCHGEGGAGDGVLAAGLSPPPSDWTAPDALREVAPAELYRSMWRGKLGTSMQRFDTVLDEASTWDVVFHIWSLGADAAAIESAAAYDRHCQACHGPHGVPGSAAPGPPLLRPEWVAQSRAWLEATVARAHPGLDAGARAAASERIWQFLTVPAADGAIRSAPAR